jgi:formylglycine-generating enzyme
MTDRYRIFASVAAVLLGCSKAPLTTGSTGGAGSTGGGSSGGEESSANGATTAAAGSETQAGAGGGTSTPVPRLHPPPGFESCVHAKVNEDCADGWCRLPPSCFVMGSPEGEWHRGRDSENQTAVTLTHGIEVQQKELTRAEWEAITSTRAQGPELCGDPQCPVAMVSWWDAVHAANLLSEQKGLEPCYDPVGCSGTLGKDLVCTGVADPTKSVYECEGYRLPTRAEAEYAARAGTVSTWYSGDITEYWPDNVCAEDPALELIAWYCNNSDDRPHIGGQLQPNGFRLYDMIGNLSEWATEEDHSSSSPGGENPRGGVGTDARRMRYGPQYDVKSWSTRVAGVSSAPWDGRALTIGFRLVRTLPD